jgi:hypothetical protein
MTSLGEKLKATMALLAEAKVNAALAQSNADMERIRIKREKRVAFADRIMAEIVASITAGRVPYLKITNYDDRSWITSAEKGQAEFQNLWSDLIRELGKEKLELQIKIDHDGQGMKDWMIITVNPTKHPILYRGTIRQPNVDELAMDPRPAPDVRIVTDEAESFKRIL